MPKSESSPSALTVECMPMPDSGLTLGCLSCGDTMNYLRAIQRLGVRPELLIFVCPSCKDVDTKETHRLRRR